MTKNLVLNTNQIKILKIFLFILFITVNIFVSLYSISHNSWIWETDNIQQIIFGTTSGFVSFSGIVAVLKINHNKKSGYWWGILNSIAFGIFSLSINLTGDLIVNIIYIFLIIFMLLKNKNNTNIQERRLEKKSIMILSLILIVTFLLFFFLIPELNSVLANALNLPNFIYGSNFTYYWVGRTIDSLMNSISIIAFITMVSGYQKTWYIWISKNILAVIFFSGVGVLNISILIMNILFFILSIYNLRTRIKTMKIAIIGPENISKKMVMKYLEDNLKDFKFFDKSNDMINENFEKYSKNLQSNAFEMQKNIFINRKKEIQNLTNFKNVVIDRYLIDDFITSQTYIEVNNFTKEESKYWKKIEKKYFNFLDSIPRLDYVFLLDDSNEEIKKRKECSQDEKTREFEVNNQTFFEKVNEKYKSLEFISSISKYSKKYIILENNDSEQTANKIKQIISENM